MVDATLYSYDSEVNSYHIKWSAYLSVVWILSLKFWNICELSFFFLFCFILENM